jgi:LPXTG-motif cell wall-anchored protein
VVESAGPNRGDGDGNGVLDCFEKNVASSCTKPDKCSAIVTTGQCGALKNTKILQEKDLPVQDPLYDYPFGLYVFDIACTTNASMVQYWYGAPNNATQYTRKYGPTTPGDTSTTKYFDFPSDSRETVTIGGQSVLKVTQTLRDGGFGDATGVDGIIRDPTGVAVLATASSTPASLLAKTGGSAANVLFVLAALSVMALAGYALANKKVKVIQEGK